MRSIDSIPVNNYEVKETRKGSLIYRYYCYQQIESKMVHRLRREIIENNFCHPSLDAFPDRRVACVLRENLEIWKIFGGHTRLSVVDSFCSAVLMTSWCVSQAHSM